MIHLQVMNVLNIWGVIKVNITQLTILVMHMQLSLFSWHLHLSYQDLEESSPLPSCNVTPLEWITPIGGCWTIHCLACFVFGWWTLWCWSTPCAILLPVWGHFCTCNLASWMWLPLLYCMINFCKLQFCNIITSLSVTVFVSTFYLK